MSKGKRYTEEEKQRILAEYHLRNEGITAFSRRDDTPSYQVLKRWLEPVNEQGATQPSAPVPKKQDKAESIGDFFQRFRKELEQKVISLETARDNAKKALDDAELQLMEAKEALEKLPH